MDEHFYISRAALQNALGISWTTLERWLQIYGCPVEKAGSQGNSWEFYFPDVVRFALDHRLLSRAHKISIPCQQCGTWVRCLKAGAQNSIRVFCNQCRDDRQRMFEDL